MSEDEINRHFVEYLQKYDTHAVVWKRLWNSVETMSIMRPRLCDQVW